MAFENCPPPLKLNHMGTLTEENTSDVQNSSSLNQDTIPNIELEEEKKEFIELDKVASTYTANSISYRIPEAKQLTMRKPVDKPVSLFDCTASSSHTRDDRQSIIAGLQDSFKQAMTSTNLDPNVNQGMHTPTAE